MTPLTHLEQFCAACDISAYLVNVSNLVSLFPTLALQAGRLLQDPSHDIEVGGHGGTRG